LNNNKVEISEQDIIDFYLKNKDDKAAVILLVLKGFSGTFSKALETITPIAKNYVPQAEIVIPIANFLSELINKAFACSLTDNPNDIIKNHKVLELLRKYYHNKNEGDRLFKLGGSKVEIMKYYNEMWIAADDLNKEKYKNVFEKKKWLTNLFKADALSYIGSTNTYTKDFENGDNKFNSALLELEQIKDTKDKWCVPDRMIEIVSYQLSNELRNVNKIKEFIISDKIKVYNNKIDEYLKMVDTDYQELGYYTTVSGEIIRYLDDHNKNHDNEHLAIRQNINSILQKINAKKINRAKGKYYSILGSYNFIEFGYNKGNQNENIENTKINISKGLEYLAKSYFGDDNIKSLNDYFLNNDYYDRRMQSDIARNYTILYGLGYSTSDDALISVCLSGLAKTANKTNGKDKTEFDIFRNSVNVAINGVLKPFFDKFSKPIEGTDEFIDRICKGKK